MKRRHFINILTIFFFAFIPTKKVNSLTNRIPRVGEKAPNFSLSGFELNSNKIKVWDNESLTGSWVVLYFYPKDFTSGCTIEAKEFERVIPQFNELKTQVIGISADSLQDHESFCNEEKLSFPLLSDPSGKISKSFGSWEEPYSLRNTFLINPDGYIEKKWIGVRPITHPKEVLQVIKELEFI